MEPREATPDDVPALRALARRSWETDPLTRETAEDALREWYAEANLRAAVRAPDELVLVADDGGVVGFSHSVVHGEGGSVLRLYVDPDARRAGVGTALLDATVTALAERGVERVQAMVLEANEPGRAFYAAAGFDHVETAATTIGGREYPECVYARDVGI